MFDRWAVMLTISSRALATREHSLGGAVAGKDIIVIGGSAGAVEALRALVQKLPADLGAAALAYGSRVIAVVLSGRLDDGTAGLWAVKERGGIAVVQDPGEASQPDMPRNALEYTDADHVVPSAELGPLLARLTPAEQAR